MRDMPEKSMVSVEESRASSECTPHRAKQSCMDTSGCSPDQKGITDGFFYLFLTKNLTFLLNLLLPRLGGSHHICCHLIDIA